MVNSREKLVAVFKKTEMVDIPNLMSLNEWKLKKSIISTKVAGSLAYKNSLPYLVGHNHELLLENFTENTPVYMSGQSETPFTVRSLRDGDKIVISFGETKIDKVWVLSLNLLNSGVSVFDHQQKWITDKKWNEFIKRIEQFFVIQKFYKAQTPNLVVCPGLEPTLDPFSVNFKINNVEKKLFLPTSPELHLKKIISQGVTEVFEITSCFRNDEVGKQHQPEFTMLEWYRCYKKLTDLIEDIKKMINFICPGDKQVDYRVTTINELFLKHLGFDLKPETSQKEIYQLALENNINVDIEDSFDDIFFVIFMDKIENKLGAGGVDFIFDYPPSQAALAKINKEGWADRFEMYWNGYEIANAFNELTCPEVQRKRFAKEQQERDLLGKEFIPIDEEFINSLNYGLPPTAGIAMGLERLFMACFNVGDIKKIKQFSI